MAEEDVYCTLLLNDGYLPGAQVLAHSLRDAGTTKRLAIMVTLAGVSKSTVSELKKVYDYVIPVDPIYSDGHSGLELMDRLDLNAALTKIHLWEQTQFRKVVYVDADIVALRAPDELFDVEAVFSASPDVGWPDCFNSGMFVTKPSKKTFEELSELAKQGETFDGADQGLLNQYFADWNRLPFTYNMTVVGGGSGVQHYQYAPAFRHYGANVTMAHFIGDSKPWNRGNAPGSGNGGAYDQMSSKWWSVYDKHQTDNSFSAAQQRYAASKQAEEGGSTYSATKFSGSTAVGGGNLPESTYSTQIHLVDPTGGNHIQAAPAPTTTDTLVPTTVGSKFVPIRSINILSRFEGATTPAAPAAPAAPTIEPARSTHYQEYVSKGRHERVVITKEGPVSQEQYFQTGARTYYIQDYWPSGDLKSKKAATSPKLEVQTITFSAPHQNWDPTRSPPPTHGAPEADMLHLQPFKNEWDNPNPTRHYQPFVPPEFAPPPKHHLWYDIPKSDSEKTIFPWEAKARQTTRVFSEHGHTLPRPIANPEIELWNAEVEEKPVEKKATPRYAPRVFLPPVTTAPLKALFPWEEKPRTVTRVFAGEEYTPEVSYEEYKDEEDAESVVESDAGDSWGWFSSRENKWDTNPAIQDYVLGLRRRKVVTADVSGGPAATRDAASSQARRSAPTWVNDQFDDQEEEWDPEQRLQELRRLPASFIAQLMAKHMTNTSMQTEEFSDQFWTPPASPTYSDSSMQTDSISVEDSAVQCEFDLEYDIMINGEDSIHENHLLSTSLGLPPYQPASFNFEDASINLKAISGVPIQGGGKVFGRSLFRRSIDSALNAYGSESP